MTYHPRLHRLCPNDPLASTDVKTCGCCCTPCLDDCAGHEEQHTNCMRPKRFFWWSAKQLTFRWKLIYTGTEELCNRTLGIRVPGGVAFICLNVPLRRWTCDECLNLAG